MISSSTYAIADTGTTMILGPETYVTALHSILDATLDVSTGWVCSFLLVILKIVTYILFSMLLTVKHVHFHHFQM